MKGVAEAWKSERVVFGHVVVILGFCRGRHLAKGTLVDAIVIVVLISPAFQLGEFLTRFRVLCFGGVLVRLYLPQCRANVDLGHLMATGTRSLPRSPSEMSYRPLQPRIKN